MILIDIRDSYVTVYFQFNPFYFWCDWGCVFLSDWMNITSLINITATLYLSLLQDKGDFDWGTEDTEGGWRLGRIEGRERVREGGGRLSSSSSSKHGIDAKNLKLLAGIPIVLQKCISFRMNTKDNVLSICMYLHVAPATLYIQILMYRVLLNNVTKSLGEIEHVIFSPK